MLFDLVHRTDYIDRFLYIEPSLHPWEEAYLIMVKDCLDVFLDSRFSRILLNIFESMFMRKIGLKFSFFVGSLCSLGEIIIVALKNKLGSVSSVCILWNIFESIYNRSSMMV